jgi:lambda repressor-like predicted transcriptional regulator
MANWSQVHGAVGHDGALQDVFEQSQPREERVIASMLDKGPAA